MKHAGRHHLATGDKMGEGWLLTAEMIELVEGGYEQHRLRPALRLPAQPHRAARA